MGFTEQVLKNMQAKSTEELRLILKENNRDEWTGEAFSIIRDVLEQRGEQIPDQPETKQEGDSMGTLEPTNKCHFCLRDLHNAEQYCSYCNSNQSIICHSCGQIISNGLERCDNCDFQVIIKCKFCEGINLNQSEECIHCGESLIEIASTESDKNNTISIESSAKSEAEAIPEEPNNAMKYKTCAYCESKFPKARLRCPKCGEISAEYREINSLKEKLSFRLGKKKEKRDTFVKLSFSILGSSFICSCFFLFVANLLDRGNPIYFNIYIILILLHIIMCIVGLIFTQSDINRDKDLIIRIESNVQQLSNNEITELRNINLVEYESGDMGRHALLFLIYLVSIVISIALGIAIS